MKKNAGIISIILSTLSIILSFSYIGEMQVGDFLAKAFNIKIYVNIISFLSLIFALILAYVYKDSYLSKSAKILALLTICIFVLITILSFLLKQLNF
ncbi:hypothetical protein FDA52_04735 [Clostridium botulinum]|nr:hypothetical protein [Clostridium botulinum]